jgi:putative CGCGG family rSAM target protein
MADSIRSADSREPVTRRTHDHPWAANLETERHADDRGLVVGEALDAVRQTRPGQYVDLVTHESHGCPETYLCPELKSTEEIEITDSGRCACGGYIFRIWIPR